ncbi:hypothetical protein [Grimontia sp. NTOU-MAR1]|uniref:hypothetical protein n=1 Tax=Grimontia sp. NTOU-MAR1 TaxID=3111011 RepID=UPI002DB5F9CE|nr:hypothetical protein [Grimontia sp. NTOU-MAR1]WRV97966.1 hypothetical protein VP504_00565 [Grimontia sp. NTOU-MAR1]
MIDYITNQRVLVQFDEDSCPFIEISNYSDADNLDDILTEEYHLIYIFSSPEHLKNHGGKRFHFGALIDTKKLQEILDDINLNQPVVNS